jgi:hypothetical protein
MPEGGAQLPIETESTEEMLLGLNLGYTVEPMEIPSSGSQQGTDKFF